MNRPLLIKRVFGLFLILCLFVFWAANASKHSSPVLAQNTLRFVIKNAGVAVTGSFDSLYPVIQYNKTHPEKSRFSLLFPVKTIQTGNSIRDKHLKDKDYFNAAQFPHISFESSAVKSFGRDSLTVSGILKVKGVVHKIVLGVRMKEQNGFRFYSGSCVFNRRTLGVGGYSLFLSDEVLVYFESIEKL